MLNWRIVYKGDDITVKKWDGLISIIKTSNGKNVEIIIDEYELECIKEALEEDEY